MGSLWSEIKRSVASHFDHKDASRGGRTTVCERLRESRGLDLYIFGQMTGNGDAIEVAN